MFKIGGPLMSEFSASQEEVGLCFTLEHPNTQASFFFFFFFLLKSKLLEEGNPSQQSTRRAAWVSTTNYHTQDFG